MLVFVDESAAKKRTLDRKYGWAPRGVSVIDLILKYYIVVEGVKT